MTLPLNTLNPPDTMAPHLGANLPENLFVAAEDQVEFDRSGLSRRLLAFGFLFDPSKPIRQFAGGYANRNYLIEVDGDPVVLRRPPAGVLPKGAHDMAREHRILSALAPVLPLVPRGVHFCEDPAVIGAPFQLIEYRPGLVIRRRMPADAPPGSGETLSDMLVETLASVHAVDVAACNLGDLGRPDGFIERTIRGWLRRGGEVIASSLARARLEFVADWLGAQRIGAGDATLLHLDFKLDNLVLDPATLRPVALLDWDMGTRGHPLFDLATLLSYWPDAGDPPGLTASVEMPTLTGGFRSRREAATLYTRTTGRDLADLPALHVLAVMKLAVVFLQLDRQWTSGAVKGDRYREFRARGEALLDFAADLTLKGEL